MSDSDENNSKKKKPLAEQLKWKSSKDSFYEVKASKASKNK
jgi:hypothetical protein